MDTSIKHITQAERNLAASSLKLLARASQNLKGSTDKGVELFIQETGTLITVPKKALELLFVIMQNMAEGQAVSLIPSSSELTTQQAADLLNVSRPFVVKLLETGKIPFKKVGSHRRVILKDVLAYKHKLAQEREKQLDFLASQAQSLNLGYE